MGPDAHTLYPIEGYDKAIFLKNCIQAPNIFVGDYTYYDDRRYGPEQFEENNVLYNYHHDKVKLVIGKFCALAAETTFIMTGDHKLDGFSTYPFPIFGKGWESAFSIEEFPMKGDIIVGNDVWFGFRSLIMPGVTIGHGSIIAAGTVVKKDVPPYSVVAGNPGKVVKKRFNEKTIERLLEIAWWDWEIEKINRNLKQICYADLEALQSGK